MNINIAVLTKSAARTVRNFSCDERGLRDVPEKLLTREVCLAVVKACGLELARVPDHFRDRGICVAAVRNDGRALAFVPWEKRDRGICVEAIRNVRHDDGFPEDNLLFRIPESLRDATMCLEAARFAVPDDQILLFVPRRSFSLQLIETAVRVDGMNLRFVPEGLRVKAVCVDAVRNAGRRAIQFVPEFFRREVMLGVRNVCV